MTDEKAGRFVAEGVLHLCCVGFNIWHLRLQVQPASALKRREVGPLLGMVLAGMPCILSQGCEAVQDVSDALVSNCRLPGNKNVLQPFADAASMKAAGGRLFQDIAAAQTEAAITITCSISTCLGPAFSEGTRIMDTLSSCQTCPPLAACATR